MLDFKKIIDDLRKTFMDTYKSTKGLNKYMLFGAYSRVNNFFKLDFKSVEEFKKILLDAEKEVYVSKQKLLSDEEIIVLEYEKMKKKYDEIKSINEINGEYDIDNIEFQKLALIEYYFQQILLFKELEQEKQKEYLGAIKLIIAQIDILLGIENGLYYTTFLFLATKLGYSHILEGNENNSKKVGGKK